MAARCGLPTEGSTKNTERAWDSEPAKAREERVCMCVCVCGREKRRREKERETETERKREKRERMRERRRQREKGKISGSLFPRSTSIFGLLPTRRQSRHFENVTLVARQKFFYSLGFALEFRDPAPVTVLLHFQKWRWPDQFEAVDFRWENSAGRGYIYIYIHIYIYTYIHIYIYI